MRAPQNIIKNRKSILDYSIAEGLLALVIFLLPYDAIRFLPALYRPLSLIPLIILFIVLLPKFFKNDLDRAQQYYLLYYITTTCLTSVRVALGWMNISNFQDYFITASIGIALFFCCDEMFRRCRYNYGNENYKIYFARCIAGAYYFPIVIACLDTLSVYGILPDQVRILIHTIFGSGANNFRICGVSSEASWLVMHLLFAGAIYAYLFKKFRKRRYITFSILCFTITLLTVSMNGIIIILLALFIYWLIQIKKGFTVRRVLIPVVLLCVAIFMGTILAQSASDAYFIQRFKNLSFSYLFHNDISVFLRIGNPLIALLAGIEYFPFGIGGGNYPAIYEKYITELFPWVLNVYDGNNEVVGTIVNGIANAKSLLPRVFAESGVFSLFYFIMIYVCLRKLRGSNKDFQFIGIVIFCCILQFDSLCFFLWIVFLAFGNNLEGRNFTRGKHESFIG